MTHMPHEIRWAIFPEYSSSATQRGEKGTYGQARVGRHEGKVSEGRGVVFFTGVLKQVGNRSSSSIEFEGIGDEADPNGFPLSGKDWEWLGYEAEERPRIATNGHQ
jgi:hypothetical protein